MGFLQKIFGPKGPAVQPVHVTEDTFVDEVLRCDLPVLLDVWSPGCSPCRMLDPVVMSLAARYQGRVKVAELDGSEALGVLARFGIMGTPTVLFFRRGREVERVTGFVGERYLAEIVDTDLLGGGAAPA
jgi:thioredoxin 1